MGFAYNGATGLKTFTKPFFPFLGFSEGRLRCHSRGGLVGGSRGDIAETASCVLSHYGEEDLWP